VGFTVLDLSELCERQAAATHEEGRCRVVVGVGLRRGEVRGRLVGAGFGLRRHPLVSTVGGAEESGCGPGRHALRGRTAGTADFAGPDADGRGRIGGERDRAEREQFEPLDQIVRCDPGSRCPCEPRTGTTCPSTAPDRVARDQARPASCHVGGRGRTGRGRPRAATRSTRAGWSPTMGCWPWSNCMMGVRFEIDRETRPGRSARCTRRVGRAMSAGELNTAA